MQVTFDYEVGIFIETGLLLSQKSRDFCFKLQEVERLLRKGDLYMCWCDDISSVVSALRFSGWKYNPNADFSNHMVSLYLPNSRLLKFTKGNNVIVLGYMESGTKTYSLSMTVISL